MNFRDSSRYSERQKLALEYSDAVLWNPDLADEAMWERLHAEFTEPQLVELGAVLSITGGGQRWIKTLKIANGEFLADTSTGLAPGFTAES